MVCEPRRQPSCTSDATPINAGLAVHHTMQRKSARVRRGQRCLVLHTVPMSNMCRGVLRRATGIILIAHDKSIQLA